MLETSLQMSVAACVFLLVVQVSIYAIRRFIVSPPLESGFLEVARLDNAGKGAVALITGGCSGIGLETAIQLYRAVDMDIILGCRDETTAEAICKHLTTYTGSDIQDKSNSDSSTSSSSSSSSSNRRKCFAPGPLDLSSFESVRSFASSVSHIPGKVPSILILNAGIRHNNFNLTGDGIESHYQINYLSHFLLVNLLLPIMNKSPAEEIRVVHVSSTAHYFGKIDRKLYGVVSQMNKKEISPFIAGRLKLSETRYDDAGDVIFEGNQVTIDYNEIQKHGREVFYQIQNNRLEGVYGDTKLMQVLFSDELQKRFDSNLNQRYNRPIAEKEERKADLLMKKKKFKSISVHPGFVNSNMGHEDSRWMQTMLVLARPFLARNLFEGSLSTLYAAVSPHLHGGEYIDNCVVTPVLSRGKIESRDTISSLPPGSEPDIARFLWDTSAKLCGLTITLEYNEE